MIEMYKTVLNTHYLVNNNSFKIIARNNMLNNSNLIILSEVYIVDHKN